MEGDFSRTANVLLTKCLKQTKKQYLSLIGCDYAPCYLYHDLVCYFIEYMQGKGFLQGKKNMDTEYYHVLML